MNRDIKVITPLLFCNLMHWIVNAVGTEQKKRTGDNIYEHHHGVMQIKTNSFRFLNQWDLNYAKHESNCRSYECSNENRRNGANTVLICPRSDAAKKTGVSACDDSSAVVLTKFQESSSHLFHVIITSSHVFGRISNESDTWNAEIKFFTNFFFGGTLFIEIWRTIF